MRKGSRLVSLLGGGILAGFTTFFGGYQAEASPVFSKTSYSPIEVLQEDKEVTHPSLKITYKDIVLLGRKKWPNHVGIAREGLWVGRG